jgi:hypothetical protein
MSTQVARRGSIPQAMAWMIGLSVALFWIPFLGSLIAGFVGGRKAGGIGEGLIAAVLPGVILLLTSILLGSLLGWIPVIGQLVGWMLGMGAWVLGFVNVIPLLLGAAVGGATAK